MIVLRKFRYTNETNKYPIVLYEKYDLPATFSLTRVTVKKKNNREDFSRFHKILSSSKYSKNTIMVTGEIYNPQNSYTLKTSNINLKDEILTFCSNQGTYIKIYENWIQGQNNRGWIGKFAGCETEYRGKTILLNLYFDLEEPFLLSDNQKTIQLSGNTFTDYTNNNSNVDLIPDFLRFLSPGSVTIRSYISDSTATFSNEEYFSQCSNTNFHYPKIGLGNGFTASSFQKYIRIPAGKSRFIHTVDIDITFYERWI